jgi:hypothetical protein
MVNSKSRVQNPAKGLSSGQKIAMLVRALNSDLGGKMKGNRKIVDSRELLVLVKRFQELDAVLADSSIALFWHRNDGEIEYSDEVLAKFRAVNRLLRRFSATPSIFPEYMADLNPASRSWRFNWGRTGQRNQPFIEVGLVLDIVEIASSGRISSLKQCANCRKWLFARFPHQRFCADSCKEDFHRSNEADKKRRREWAKQNYWLHKNKNIK